MSEKNGNDKPYRGMRPGNMEEQEIYRKNGKLNVNIEIDRNLSMLQL